MKKITFFIFLLAFSLGFSQDPATGPMDPPARDAGDVVSFYNGIATPMGDDYTNISGVTFDSFGGSTIVGDVTLTDNNTVVKYTGHNFSGIGGGNYDVSQMEILHIDVYSPDFLNFKIKLEATNGSNVELDVAVPPTQSAWNSYEIDLSLYSAVDLANLKWIVPVSNASPSTLYLDNVYFYRTPVDPTTDATLSVLEVENSSVSGFSSSVLNYDYNVPSGTTVVPQITIATPTQAGASAIITQAMAVPGTATVVVTASDMMTTETYTVNIVETGPSGPAPTPPARDAGDVLSVFTPNGIYTDVAPSGIQTFFPGANTVFENFTVDTTDDTRKLTTPTPGGGVQYGYFFGNGTGFDLTDFDTMHIDIWFDDAGDVGSVLTVQLQNFDSGSGAFQHNIFTNIEVNNVGSGAWFSADLDLSTFNNSILARDNVQQIQFIAQGPTFGPSYLTNIYFYKEAGPANDNCATATVIDPTEFGQTISGTNVGATNSGIANACQEGVDVWYSFTAVQDGEVNMTIDPGFAYGFYSDCSGTLVGGCDSSIANATTGTTYYIRIGDMDTARRMPGGFNFSIAGSALSNDSFDLLSSLKIYPNPTNNNWNIEGANVTIDTVEVFDMLGKRVQALNPNSQQTTIDASSLKTGIYLAKLYSGDAVRIIKLVKN